MDKSTVVQKNSWKAEGPSDHPDVPSLVAGGVRSRLASTLSLGCSSHDRTFESRSTPLPYSTRQVENSVHFQTNGPEAHTLPRQDGTGSTLSPANSTRSSEPGVTITSTFSTVVEAELVVLTSVFYCCNFFSLWHPSVSLPCDCLWRPFFPT